MQNVHEQIRSDVAADPIAMELARVVEGLFTLTYYRTLRVQRGTYRYLHLRPTKSVAQALLLEREVLVLIADFKEVEVRTIKAMREVIAASDGRLERALALIVHGDPHGDEKLKSWGREHSLMVIPVLREPGGLVTTPDAFRRKIATDLFASDPFQVTGPVVNEMDFFGRGNEALEVLRQLKAGRIRAIFGIRKVGKTSLINRIVSLARQGGQLNIATVDCSYDRFNELGAGEALRGIAKVAKMGATQGYAHITDALPPKADELLPTFQELWEKQKVSKPLVVVFDEVDYITPASPKATHWRDHFSDFWREFRVLVQEAQRHGVPLSVLVSGVSSRAFREESVGGVENPVLHFVPDEYLSPFARRATHSMLEDLERRCGLRLSPDARELVAETCGDFPFWVRMAGSYMHRSLDVEARPTDVRKDQASALMREFLEFEGTDIARVALENMRRMYPEVVDTLRACGERGALPIGEGRMLLRYGLATQLGTDVVLSSQMIQTGLRLVPHQPPAPAHSLVATGAEAVSLALSDSQWAEELALINKRRNLLERKLRDMIRFGLKMQLPRQKSWVERVLKALPATRRSELAALSGDTLMSRLYWRELEPIISKNWELFDRTINDKKRFQLAMSLLNDRPDTHAKDVDQADVALQRRELTWLEERIAT